MRELVQLPPLQGGPRDGQQTTAHRVSRCGTHNDGRLGHGDLQGGPAGAVAQAILMVGK